MPRGRFNSAEEFWGARTIGTAPNLADTYSVQVRRCEAEKLQVEVLELLELLQRTLGPEDPRTTVTATSLAVTYGDLGRLNDAENWKV